LHSGSIELWKELLHQFCFENSFISLEVDNDFTNILELFSSALKCWTFLQCSTSLLWDGRKGAAPAEYWLLHKRYVTCNLYLCSLRTVYLKTIAEAPNIISVIFMRSVGASKAHKVLLSTNGQIDRIQSSVEASLCLCTICVEHSYSWEANSRSVSPGVSYRLWSPRFIFVFTRAHRWTMSWAKWI
jgi:hypothetical protein